MDIDLTRSHRSKRRPYDPVLSMALDRAHAQLEAARLTGDGRLVGAWQRVLERLERKAGL